jgi:hypothetical protein
MRGKYNQSYQSFQRISGLNVQVHLEGKQTGVRGGISRAGSVRGTAKV